MPNTYPHPNYLGLVINVGGTPVPGSFYVTIPGRTLSHIAKLAYGNGKLANTLRINNTAWNRDNCVYRKSSTSCWATIVAGGNALNQNTWADGTWLSLCQKDKNASALAIGSQYQVMWIPTVDNKQPSDLVSAPPPPVRAAPPPPLTVKLITPRGPTPGIFTPIDDGGSDGSRDGGSGTPVVIKKAGFPLWLGIGAGILLLGGLFVAAKKKKKK